MSLPLRSPRPSPLLDIWTLALANDPGPNRNYSTLGVAAALLSGVLSFKEGRIARSILRTRLGTTSAMRLLKAILTLRHAEAQAEDGESIVPSASDILDWLWSHSAFEALLVPDPEKRNTHGIDQIHHSQGSNGALDSDPRLALIEVIDALSIAAPSAIDTERVRLLMCGFDASDTPHDDLILGVVTRTAAANPQDAEMQGLASGLQGWGLALHRYGIGHTETVADGHLLTQEKVCTNS